MIIEYRFYYEGLAETEKEEVDTIVERFSYIHERGNGFFNAFFDDDFPAEKIISLMPSNIKYEKLIG